MAEQSFMNRARRPGKHKMRQLGDHIPCYSTSNPSNASMHQPQRTNDKSITNPQNTNPQNRNGAHLKQSNHCLTNHIGDKSSILEI